MKEQKKTMKDVYKMLDEILNDPNYIYPKNLELWK